MMNRLDHRFCIAPMMEWSDRHCRMLHRLLCDHARLYTEMVTAQAVIRGDRGAADRLRRARASRGAATGRRGAGARWPKRRRSARSSATTRST